METNENWCGYMKPWTGKCQTGTITCPIDCFNACEYLLDGGSIITLHGDVPLYECAKKIYKEPFLKPCKCTFKERGLKCLKSSRGRYPHHRQVTVYFPYKLISYFKIKKSYSNSRAKFGYQG